MDEKRVIRPRTDDTDLDPILWVPPGESVETIEALAAVKVIAGALAVNRKCAWIERDVDRPPPNLVL